MQMNTSKGSKMEHKGSHMEHGKKDLKEDKGSMTDHAVSGVYICPMHPEVQSDQAGHCPKCGMKLRLKTETQK